MINLKHSLICGVLLLQLVNHTSKWEGSDLPGHSYAKFEDLNGRQAFKIKLDKKASFVLNYRATLDSGELHFEIKSPGKTVFSSQIKRKESGEIKIENLKREKYQFILKGKHATGSYDVTYKEM